MYVQKHFTQLKPFGCIQLLNNRIFYDYATLYPWKSCIITCDSLRQQEGNSSSSYIIVDGIPFICYNVQYILAT